MLSRVADSVYWTARYVERVRVEAAKIRLAGGDEPLGAVARAVGFGSEETLRRAIGSLSGAMIRPTGRGRSSA